MAKQKMSKRERLKYEMHLTRVIAIGGLLAFLLGLKALGITL